MRRPALSLGLGSALAACLVIGVAGTAHAATLDFTGTLQLKLSAATVPAFVIPGTGSAQVTDNGNFHLLSFMLPGGTFGPTTTWIPLLGPTFTGLTAFRLTLTQNLTGSFSGISGGPPGGGPMGLSGIAKLCFGWGQPTGACATFLPLPLTPSGTPTVGFGIGGTRTATGSVNATLQNAPWTIGQPVMTIHTPGSTISTPALPGGFAHGPASLTSSTAQTSGVLQLVTATKVYTNLPAAIPETPLSGVLTLHFVPEPGTLLMLGLGVVGLTAAGRRRSRR